MPFTDHARLEGSVSADFRLNHNVIPADIRGSGGMMGGGGKGGKGAAKSDAKNTLRSNAKAQIVEVLGEGEIVGLVDGAKSIYFDTTPLQNPDGSFNFKGVQWQQRAGQPDQEILHGVAGTQTPFQVGVEIKNKQTPPVRVIAEANATSVRVIVNIQSLVQQDQKSGSLLAADLDYVVERRANGGQWEAVVRELFLQQKTTSPYQKATVIDLPDGGHPYSIRVRKVSIDHDVEWYQANMSWESFTVITAGKFIYPNTAMVAMDIDASNFGSSIAARYYDVKGLIIQVPSNYDPEMRRYNGFWDGTFKRAWSDNPAWIFYDLVTNNRYGLGEFISAAKVDKVSLYTIAQWCDQLVDDGKGGKEPRYTYNGVINTREDAFKVLQQIATSWRGMAFWSVGQVFAIADMPADYTKILAPANVIGGAFKYSRTAKKTRNSVAMVSWNDPEDFYRPAIEVVQHDEALERFGWRTTDISAVGCTSRGLAHRIGKWTLDTEHTATETVEFEMALEALANDPIRPGHIIAVADPRKAQTRIGGRVADRNGHRVTLDKAFEPLPGSTYRLSVVLASGNVETQDIVGWDEENTVAILANNLAEPIVMGAMWAITGTDVAPRQYRVLSVTEPKKNTFKIAALFHDPQKYARVEEGIVLDPIRYTRPKTRIAPVTNLDVHEHQTFRNGTPVTETLISWSPANDWLSNAYSVFLVGPDGETDMGTTGSPSMTIQDLKSGAYTVYVTALGMGNARSEPAEKDFEVKGWEGQVGPEIANLRVRGAEAGSGIFGGKDCTVDWDVKWPEGIIPYAVDFVVRVFDVDTRQLLSDWLNPNQAFTYYFDDNVADGGPRRKFWIQVRARDVLGRESNPATLVCENPAPAMVIPDVQPTTESVFVSYDTPTDADFAGGMTWMEREPGFDPLTTKPAYDGPNTLFTLKATKEVFYYVRFAAYDVFSKTGLNISPEQRVYVTNKIIDVNAPEIPTELHLSTRFQNTLAGPSASIKGTWAASLATNFKSFQVEIKRQQDDAWTRFGVTDPVWEIHGLQPGEIYEVRVRALNGSDRESGWSEVEQIRAALNDVAPDPITEFTAEGAFQNAFLSWKDPANKDLAYVEILGSDTANGLRVPMGRAMPGQQGFSDPTLAAKGQRFYWARTANTSGTVSEVFVGPVSATSAGITKEMLAGKILDQTAFADGLTLIGTYDGVPPVEGWDGPLIITNKRDGKLWQLKDGAWGLVVAEVKVEDIVGKITSDMLAEIDAAKLAGQLTSEQIKNLDANKLIGQLVDSQLESLGVNKLIGQLKASQLEAIEATKLIGQLSADQLKAIEATKLIGQITPAQIQALEAVKLIGTISADQIAAIEATKLIGKITKEQIEAIEATKLIGTLTAAQLQAIEATKLIGQLSPEQLAGLEAVKIIGKLSSEQLAGIEAAKLIGTLSSDQIAAINAAKVVGQLRADQLEAIEATKLIGTLSSAQLSAIEAAKIVGKLSSDQLSAIEATKLIGKLSSDQITSIDAAKVGGKLTAAQIESIAATQVAGTLRPDQLAGIEAAKVSGTLRSDQLAGIESAKLIGPIVDGQLQSISVNKLNGQLSSDQIHSLAAAKLAGQITETQITDNAISTGKLQAASVTTAVVAAGAITASRLQVASSNLMFNGDLSQGLLGFFDGPEMSVSTDWAPAGFKAIHTHMGGSPAAGGYRDISFCRVDTAGNRLTYPVTAGARYELSASVSVHRCVAQVYFEWLNAEGQVIGYTGAGGNVNSNGASGGDIRNFPRCFLFGQAPGGATQVNLRGRMLHTGEIDPYVFWSALQFTSAVAGQTEPSPYVAPGVTTITGSSVLTGSLHADKIIAGTITAGHLQARTITAAQIATGTLTANEIGADQITAHHILARTITSQEIAAGTISANEIGANQITAYHVSARTITAQQIATGTLTANEIGAYVITGEKIAGRTISAGNLVAGTITADEIAVRSIVGDNIAGYTIQAYNLIAHSITSDQIAASSIVGWNIKGRTIEGGHIVAGSIAAGEIAVGSLTGDRIAARTINATNLVANTITADQIAGNTIVGWNIQGRTIQAGHIVAGSITAGEIAAGSITGDRIAGRTISAANLIAGSITAGEIAADQITGLHLKANTIGTREIIANVITANQIAAQTIVGWNVAARTIDAGNLVAGSITAGEIKAGAITGDRIAGRTILATNLVAGTITADEIAVRSIKGDNIAGYTIQAYNLIAHSITADQIAVRSIVGDNIAGRTIQAYNLIANSITANEVGVRSLVGDNIAGRTIQAYNLIAGSITAGEIAARAITGDNIAGRTIQAYNLIAGSITAGEIAANTLTANQIAANTIVAWNIAVGTLTAREIAARSISADRLVVNSITADQIAGSSIIGWNIQARTLTAGHLTANTITAGEIAAKTIVAWNIAAGTITGDEIRGNSVHADRLIANSITAGQIAAGAIRAEAISAGAITADSLAVGLTTGNFFFNSDFQANNAGFIARYWSDGVQPETGHRTDWAPQGMGSAMVHRGGYPASRTINDYVLSRRTQDGWSDRYPVTPGQRYEFTAYVSVHRARAQVLLQFVDANGNGVGGVPVSNEQGDWQSNGPLEQWMRLGVFGTAPDGAVAVIPTCRTLYTGENEPYTFWTGLYLGKATRNQSQFSTWARGMSTVIDGGIVATNSLHAEKIIAGTITADKIRANTITGDQIQATTISGWHIQANSIYADRIQIGGGQSMTSWLGGPNNTQMNGGYIAANSIAANSLKIGARGLTILGIEFSADKSTQTLRWTGGHIAWVDDAGNQQHTGIAAGEVGWNGWISVTWFKGRGYLDWSNDGNGGWNRDYAHPEAVPMAFYNGWTGLNVLKGGSTIDGTKINAGTITANQIMAGQIQTGHLAAGSITAEKIAAGNVTADKIGAGTITAGTIYLGSGRFALDANSRRMLIHDNNGRLRAVYGDVGGWLGYGDDVEYGQIVWDRNGQIIMHSGGLNGQSIWARTISAAQLQANTITAYEVTTNQLISNSAQIGSLTVDTLNVRDGAISSGAVAESRNHEVWLGVSVRGNGFVKLDGSMPGNHPFTNYGVNGDLLLTRFDQSGNGVDIESVPGNYFPSNGGQVMLATQLTEFDRPGPGYWTYRLRFSNTEGRGEIKLSAIELAK